MSSTALSPGTDPRIAAIRRFNRFYTRQIGVLEEEVYRSPFSLAEVRVLYELAHREKPTAKELGQDLGVDAGYLSRILSRFEKRGFVTKTSSEHDGRQSLLSLTPQGRKAFAPLDMRSSEEVRKMMAQLTAAQQDQVIAAMSTIEQSFAGRAEHKPAYILRNHRPGDMGWVVYRHGVLYADEYGWDEHFEALVAGIVAKFVQHFDPRRERCWIAEKDGENVGSVFLVQHTKTVAKLRMLLVEPSARGLGIGKRLVDECVRFAKQAGYRKMILWTQSNLTAARSIYQKAGFQLSKKEAHHSWGHDLISEVWELKL